MKVPKRSTDNDSDNEDEAFKSSAKNSSTRKTKASRRETENPKSLAKNAHAATTEERQRRHSEAPQKRRSSAEKKPDKKPGSEEKKSSSRSRSSQEKTSSQRKQSADKPRKHSSNKSHTSRKSKDDTDIKVKKTNAPSGDGRRKNLEKFEKLLASSQDNDTVKPPKQSESERKRGGDNNGSTQKHQSKDNGRPKLRKSDAMSKSFAVKKTSRSTIDNHIRRSSVDSSKASSRRTSMETILSYDSDEDDKRDKSEPSGPTKRLLLRRSSDSARWEKTSFKQKRASLDETNTKAKTKVTDSTARTSKDDNDDDASNQSGKKKNRRQTELSQKRKPAPKMARSKSMKVVTGKHRSLKRMSSSFNEGVDSKEDDKPEGNTKTDGELAKKRPHSLKKGESFRRRKTADSDLLRESSHDGEGSAVKHKAAPGQVTSELDASAVTNNSPSSARSRATSFRKSARSRKSSRRERIPKPIKASLCQRIERRKWQCLCCITLVILLVVASVIMLVVFRAYEKKNEEIQVATSTQAGNQAGTEADNQTGTEAGNHAGTEAAIERPTSIEDLSTNLPSAAVSLYPSMVPTEHATTTAPTPSPVANVAIAIIVQLDAKPEETGFSLMSADNSTTYVSRPVGSLSGLQSEVVMEVISIPEQTELLFELTDKSGDGLCCIYGKGYYRVFAGTGDQKTTMISGEQSGSYRFTVGRNNALQIGGVDPNEYCKACPDGKDCGRCAWCNADGGFLPDTIFSYQCRSDTKTIPKKCFIGEKRLQLHNQYVAAMAGCSNGFEAWPQFETSPDKTICVEEAKCVKTFAFVEPNCDEELSGSLLAKETCQDKIGGSPFGYSWGFNAPREKECSSSGDFAASIAPRCCRDEVAFCSTFDANNDEDDMSTFQETTSPTPMPAATTTHAPTMSNAPTWDGHPITVLIQLDEFPLETGFSITNDMNVTFLERRQGYYKNPRQLVVEKVQIPEGIDAILTLTDKEGDGICCENGNGYIQVYSDQGSLILDEAGIFSTYTWSKPFFVGEPETLPPTVSVSPSISVAPTFDQFPITIAVQLDQWSAETGFSIQSIDGSDKFFEWPAGSFSGQLSGLVIETVLLPHDIEVKFRVTDAGGDGFCCLYGDGYVKIFAGDNAEDESALLAYESAEFESDLSIIFRSGPAPTLAPATTPIPTVSSSKAASIGPTSSSPPTIDAILMTVVLQLDKFSSETAWFIGSVDGLISVVARPAGYYEEMQSQQIIETLNLIQGHEYQFRIVDFMGDGICCWAGNGWYSLYEGEDIKDNSTQVFYGNGDFGREKVHTFIAGKPKTLAPTSSKMPSQIPSVLHSMAPSHSSEPSVTTFAVEVTIKFDNKSSQTGWYIVSADNTTVIVDRPPGYFSGNDTLTVIETIMLEAGEYKFTVLDTNGDGFCCKQGLGFYSLYSNGDSLLFQQGRFKYLHDESFSIGSLPPTDNTVAFSFSKSAPMLRGSVQSSYNPKRHRKHVALEP